MARKDPATSAARLACERQIKNIEGIIDQIIRDGIAWRKRSEALVNALNDDDPDEALIKANMGKITKLIAALKATISGTKGKAALKQRMLDRAGQM